MPEFQVGDRVSRLSCEWGLRRYCVGIVTGIEAETGLLTVEPLPDSCPHGRDVCYWSGWVRHAPEESLEPGEGPAHVTLQVDTAAERKSPWRSSSHRDG